MEVLELYMLLKYKNLYYGAKVYVVFCRFPFTNFDS